MDPGIYGHVGKLPRQHFKVYLFFHRGDTFLILVEARILEYPSEMHKEQICLGTAKRGCVGGGVSIVLSVGAALFSCAK